MADRTFQVTTSLPDRQVGSTSWSGGNAPAWRKALEDAAWRDALGATRQFVEAQDALAEHAHADGSPEKPYQYPQSASRVEWLSEQAMRTIPAVAKTFDNAVQAIPPQTHDFDASAVRGAEAYLHPRPQIPARFTAQQAASWSSSPPQRMGTRCPVRNMTTTSHADGIALWIRDAQATPEQVMALLGPLRKTMGEVGAQVLRLSLNGSLVWSATQALSAIPQVKE